jgi:hypothetical protein
VDITISDRVIYSDGTNSLIKGFNMNTNINELLSLTGFELAKLGDQFEAKYGYESDTSITDDVTKLLAMNTQTPSNADVSLEMEALGFADEVLDVAAVKPAVVAVKVDLTDWDRIIK